MNVLLDDDIISEDTLECLCKLLTTIGLKMEKQDQNKEDLGDYMRRLREIVDRKAPKVNSRIRFMIQDVLDLRRSNWTPRRQDLNPKTIGQIQKEVETEQMNNHILNYQSSQQRRDDNRDNRRGGPQGNQGNYGNKRNMMQEEGGWTTQQNTKGRTQQIDIKKINLNVGVSIFILEFFLLFIITFLKNYNLTF
jgi:translation initiation factor 4G